MSGTQDKGQKDITRKVPQRWEEKRDVHTVEPPPQRIPPSINVIPPKDSGGEKKK